MSKKYYLNSVNTAKDNLVDMGFARKFKLFREEIGISCFEAAQVLGVSHHYIRQLEKGVREINFREVYFLAREFNHPMDIFFEGCGSAVN